MGKKFPPSSLDYLLFFASASKTAFVNGLVVLSAKDAALKWRGSSNQRVIDVPATLREGRVVLHAD